MGNENPYPVFENGVAADIVQQQRRRGGPSEFAWILVVIAALIGAIFVLKDCQDRREPGAAEMLQQEEARCAKDLWGSDCPAAARERIQKRESDQGCNDAARKRQAWIDATTPELEGYAPSTFHMSAIDACGATLRVQENDCSLSHLGEAYGNKAFMRTARSLGFRRVSCAFDNFDIFDVMRAGIAR